MLEYFKEADALHLDVLRSLAIGLNLGEEYFTPLCNGNHQNLRLLHYPSCMKKQISETGQKRAGAHTDYGTLTLLVQENVGGLQARRRDGVWIDVPPTKGAVIINVGDCLMRWSNDILISTPHRVIQDPSIKQDTMPPRYSIAFFCNPNKETLVKALPNTFSDSNPPKYKPINAFDYLVGRLNDTI
jgi:isopenicillin N synthase-like dioxygenase